MIVAQLEFEAKSVKKAVAKASKELRVKPTDLKYQIKSYGSSGIFGLVGARKAKISVKVPSDTPDKPARKSHAPEKKPEPSQSPRPAQTETDILPSGPGPTEAEVPAPVDRVAEEKDNTDPLEEEQVSLDEVSEHGQAFLKRLVDVITPSTTVICSQDQNKISYDIIGGNPAILIGKHGQTLEALQYLTEKAVNRTIDQRIIVEVDVAGYQAKRRENLIDQARRMADKAVKNQKPVTIGPIPPQDRRVIHLTLKPDGRVRTQSVGRGITRKLTIHPKKRRKSKQPKQR